jgi:transposase
VPHQLAPESIEELNTFSKARETLLAQKVALQNQLREAESHDPRSFKQLKDLYQASLKALDKSLLKIESELQSNLEKNQEIKTNMDLLKSIPGIGKQTALQFIIHTNNFRDFTSAKHLACYSGVVPFANESGTIVKKHRVSKMANMKLKTLLHLAAMAAVRTKTELKQYYIRKVMDGKNKMSVINAVRNKLVHRIWAVIQRQTPYTVQQEFLSN